MIGELEESRCRKCIWYEQCQKYGELEEECEFYDELEDEEKEYFWLEMSYWKYRKGGE